MTCPHKSEIGFGITRLLGFDLLPRIKRINKVRLYRPAAGEPDAYPALVPALTRPIRWELITQQYDQMMKYATAIRSGTASTEAILRRFTRSASHPTYQAIAETGRAQRHLRRPLPARPRPATRDQRGPQRRRILEPRQRGHLLRQGGDIATNRRDEQEMAVLCLRILQAALVYVNTLMLQDVLTDPGWSEALTSEDQRGLTPLFWMHVLPYGEVRLDMMSRLSLSPPAAEAGCSGLGNPHRGGEAGDRATMTVSSAPTRSNPEPTMISSQEWIVLASLIDAIRKLFSHLVLRYRREIQLPQSSDPPSMALKTCPGGLCPCAIT